MNDYQAIVDAGIASAEPSPLDPDVRYAVVVPEDGSVEVIDPTPDHLRAHPRRATGTSKVYEVEGMEVLWGKHADATSELFADRDAHSVTAVFNGDAGADGEAGHRDHRAVLQCVQTLEWREWVAASGNLMRQDQFAEFIEDHAADCVSPSATDMLELASTFEAKSKVDFKSAVHIGSGQRGLVYEETTTAKAGEKGQIEIPHTFEVALSPFEGVERYRVTARFRYRIREGVLSIGFKLDRPQDVLQAAFADVVTAVTEATSQKVLLGVAPEPRRG